MLRINKLPDMSKLDAEDKAAIEKALPWKENGTGYALEHGTRPATIGHVISSSPLAVLAWIGEKLLEWNDEPPALDAILTNISLYWFTESFPRSIYTYRESFSGSRPPPTPYIKKPVGFSYFPKEIFPGVKLAVENQANLVFYRKHTKGGHFAALERPVELLGDVEEFVGQVWKV